MSVPRIALVGNGRAGKDTAVEWLRDNTNLRHWGSTSETMLPLVALVRGEPMKACFEQRHQHRMFWKTWCDNFRKGEAYDLHAILNQGDNVPEDIEATPTVRALRAEPEMVLRWDPAKIIRLHLEKADIVPGIRGDIELISAREQGLLDLIVWIENPRVPEDPTVDFKREDADILLMNEADLPQFHFRLRRLAKSLRGVEVR